MTKTFIAGCKYTGGDDRVQMHHGLSWIPTDQIQKHFLDLFELVKSAVESGNKKGAGVSGAYHLPVKRILFGIRGGSELAFACDRSRTSGG